MSVMELLANLSKHDLAAALAGIGAIGASQAPNDAEASPLESLMVHSPMFAKDGIEVLKNPARKDFNSFLKENPDGLRAIKDHEGNSYFWTAMDGTHPDMWDALKLPENNYYDDNVMLDTFAKNKSGKISSIRDAMLDDPDNYDHILENNVVDKEYLNKYFPAVAAGAIGSQGALSPGQAEASQVEPLPDKLNRIMQNYQDRLLAETKSQANESASNISMAINSDDPFYKRAASLGLGAIEGLGIPETSVMSAAFGPVLDSIYKRPLSNPSEGDMYGRD